MLMTKKKKYPLWFEPAENFREMQEEVRDSWKDMLTPFFKMPRISMKFPETSRIIKAKLGETDDELFLVAELPGFSKDEINLKVSSKSIHISTSKKKKSIQRDEGFYKAEQSFASASRSISLPVEIDTKGIKAKLKDGILEVIMPKKESTKKEEKKVRIE